MRVHQWKMVMGLVLFLLAAGVVGGLAVLQFLTNADDAGEAIVAVVVDHPDELLHDGAVHVATATPLQALLAAAEESGFVVDVEHYPGQGSYVKSIGGHAAEGDEGWLYCVGPEPCSHPQAAADRYVLEGGGRVRWHWGTVDDGFT